MKLFVALIVSFAICSSSSAEDEFKAKVLAFWKCISCHDNPGARDDTMKCVELKPEKLKQISRDCADKTMPEATTMEDRWETICKNENNQAEEIYDCIMNENWSDISEEDKQKLGEFITCAKDVDKKYCNHEDNFYL